MKLKDARQLLAVLDALVLGNPLPHRALEEARAAVTREIRINQERSARQAEFFENMQYSAEVRPSMRRGPLDPGPECE